MKCFVRPLKMVQLLLFLTFISGVSSMTAKEIYIKAGDLVMLQCEECKHNGTVILWTMETNQKTQLYSNMSASEQQQLGLVLYQNSLVILSASLNHHGNYSCGPLRNTSSQMGFRLTVYTEMSGEFKFRNRYNCTCYTNEACTLNCPEENFPRGTRTGITWHKENGEPSEYYFPSVGLEKSGVYICTRSFFYSGQTYNTSFTVVLDVQPGAQKLLTNLGIYSPKDGQVFEVELGKTAMITCTAAIDTCDSSLFWLRKHEFVEENDTLRYFYNFACSNNTSLDDVRWMNATLVFREVLEEDLSTEFSCKLESAALTHFVTITLNKTAGPSYFILTICTVCIVVVMAVIVVTYVKFKIDVTLILRDKLGFKGCQSNTSDGKSYDAFLMGYKSDTEGGLSEEDRKCLASTLEDQFGYSLCLYDRDVLPGQAVAEAMLDCIEQSQAVVLIPSFPDPEPGSGVLNAIHASLVERKARLIFINTEQTEASRSGSFPEALHLLSKTGNSVTWKGRPPSSSFWKQLRYHLPAPQQTPKMQLLPQEY